MYHIHIEWFDTICIECIISGKITNDQVVWVQDYESWVVGLIPTQWTVLYWYVVSCQKLLPVHKV